MTTIELLGKAAGVIERRGLYKGCYMPSGADPDTCPVCVLGAINVAGGNRPDGSEPGACEIRGDAYRAAEALHGWLRRDDPPDEPSEYDPIVQDLGIGWNDAPETTPEQVITALRGCAADLARTWNQEG